MISSKEEVSMLHNIFFTLLILVFSQGVFAQKVGIALGTSQTNIETDTGVEAQSEGGLLGGALFYNNFGDTMLQRIGVLYAQKNFSMTSASVKNNVNLSYLQVPLTIGFVMNPNFSFFGGVALNLNVGKSCSYGNSSSACTVKGVKSADFGLNFGINLTFMDEFGLEIFYDRTTGKIMDGTTGASTVGVNLLYLIE
jgi:hypothetical protein